MTPHDSLKLRVLEAARQLPAPPRPADRLPRAILLASVAAMAMATTVQWAPPLLGDVGGAAHAAGRPAAVTASLLAGSVALAAVATWLVLPARRSMLAPARGVLLAVAAGVPLLVGAWLVLWHGTYDDPFTRVGWRCFTLTALTGPWPFAALVSASRRAEPRHPATTGAALGAVAGAWAAATIELWCPLTVHAHVLVGHVLPLVALVLAGAAFGARAFRPRRVP
jgi:hypothetical protein